MKLFQIEFDDGSMFTIPSHVWQVALEWKYGRGANEQVAGPFRELVDRLWAERLVLTKFGELPWDEAAAMWRGEAVYPSKAALAEQSMYAEIRAPLMAIAMGESGAGQPVIGIDDECGSVMYRGSDVEARLAAICRACCPCRGCREAEERPACTCNRG